ncbi:outer membrane beta-barrel protein [Bdellovibrio reynosensis]|uniref:PorT family protein n=1 Tax=Bdellovibrio reynosensis TaxID=2835041 RepID=A0ABY4C6L6_9BACT|nr:outer membrane beta-barrel protein [Bdellovibrio reynosensis]UOF00134.1 PorT family protein [Bdellovibrio reynosensis]
MKKLALVVFATLGVMTSAAMADVDYQLEVGVRQQSADVEAPATAKSQMGMQFGATAHMPFGEKWHFRTGMLYTQRPLIVESGATETKVSVNYLDVPLALMFKFEEHIGVFFGFQLGLNIDKTNAEDVKSPMLPIVLGTSFKFAPNMGAVLYYDNGDELAAGIEKSRAVGANLMITFD